MKNFELIGRTTHRCTDRGCKYRCRVCCCCFSCRQPLAQQRMGAVFLQAAPKVCYHIRATVRGLTIFESLNCFFFNICPRRIHSNVVKYCIVATIYNKENVNKVRFLLVNEKNF